MCIRDSSPYAPAREIHIPGRSVPLKNPKVRTVLDRVRLDSELAWTLGDYTAEGCASRTGTSGIVVFTHGYPQELPDIRRLERSFHRLGFHTKTHLTKSGFLKERGIVRFSSIQLTVASVQWMRFFRDNFYPKDLIAPKNARIKIAPSFLFGAPIPQRWAFLQGYSGDATGEWGQKLRYTSASPELLIDVAWLARISDLESSVPEGWRTVRILWPGGGTYEKSALVPSEPYRRFLASLPPDKLNGNWRYALRHSLYGSRSDRVLRDTALSVLRRVREDALSSDEREGLARLTALARSDVYPVRILDIRVEDAPEFVYDLTVPGAQSFWGGSIPLLLHNSDSRGIDTVRTTIKEYARTSALGEVGFKILFLDEADNLTSEAQASLRRLMERYSGSCRFILSCNYSSRIIDPIQSRCAVFRFRGYSDEAIRHQLERIAKAEGKQVSADALGALVATAQGDMRRAVNLLQLTATHSDTVTVDTIRSYATTPLRTEVEAMLGAAFSGDFPGARSRLYALFTERGTSGDEILHAIHAYLPDVDEKVLPAREKIRLIEFLGEVDFRLAQGASERVQLESVLAHVAARTPPP